MARGKPKDKDTPREAGAKGGASPKKVQLARVWRRRALIITAVVMFWPPVFILPLWLFDPPVTTFILGEALDRISADKSPWWPRREVVSREAMSPAVVRAILASEDDAFYLHPGFDLRQLEAALTEEGRKSLRGASTITQQTAKNLFLWGGRSYVRKALEAYVTIWLELCLSKDRILEIYLNLLECGDGAFGVEACARLHFKVPASKLSEDQAARLAAILPNPTKWSPRGEYASSRVPELRARMRVPIAKPPD